MEIRIELLKLKKTQIDLQKELEKEGISAYPSQICRAINGENSPKYQLIRDEVSKIIYKWQKENDTK
ncbi:MAG: hypothetical protein MJ123_11870 [Lachnospiraceae bacterium]|nr:hypothetical protein [Lachnospiraceae bacterium]